MRPMEMITLIRKTMHDVGGYKTNKVAVEMYGKLFYLTESEVRALQVIAKRAAEISDEVFEEFTENVIVYKGRRKGHKKDKSDQIMKFRKDGMFSTDFDPGFFDVNSKLAFELF